MHYEPLIYRSQEGDWWVLRCNESDEQTLTGPYLSRCAAEEGLRRLTTSPPSWPNRKGERT
jgi:hypothetical protein